MPNWEKSKREKFGKALYEARKSAGYNQGDLAEKVAEQVGRDRGYSQKKIHRIEYGQQTKFLKEDELGALSRLLSLTEKECELARPSEKKQDKPWIQMEDGKYLKSNVEQEEFSSYLGEYHCAFRSTDSGNDHINRGLLRLYKGADGSCGADMELFNENGRAIKYYSGIFFINTHFEACYFILRGKRWQEVSMIIAPLFTLTVEDEKNQFIIAQVLTTAAGKRKHRTVAHRMLISRKRLNKSQEQLVRSQLLMNTDSIYIRQDELQKLQAQMNKQIQAEPDNQLYRSVSAACKTIIQNSSKVTLLRIEESKIYDAREFGASDEERALVTALLRTHSEGLFYNKISETVQEILGAILEWNG